MQHTEEKTSLQFKDLDGKPIKDPRPAIAAAGDVATDAEKINYQAVHPATQTAITELWGARTSQEDRLVVGSLPAFWRLSHSDRQAALTETVRLLEADIEARKLQAGSTLCATVLCGKTIYNANVGDSESYLVIKDKDNAVTHFSRINKVIHHITEENLAELHKKGMRTIKYFGTERLTNDRGGADLNLYRSMGDRRCNSSGLEHHPDIYSLQDIDIPEGGSACVINACDGLTEQLKHEQLEKIIRDNASASLEDLAKILAKAAFDSKSGDNISVMITPVDPNAPAKYIAVFDGHGGTDVSEFLAERFHNTLERLVLQPHLDKLKTSLEGNFKSSVEGIEKQTNEIMANLARKHPKAGLDTLYESIQLNFMRTVADEKSATGAMNPMILHASHALSVITTVNDALMLSTQLGVGAPSSFDRDFKAWKGDEKTKTIIANLEGLAKDALNAFNHLPEKKEDETVREITTHLLTETKKARHTLQVVMPSRVVLETQLPNLLKGRYKNILAEAKSINDSLEDPKTKGLDAVTKLLFSLYLEAYKATRVKKLFSSSHATEDFVPQLEKLLLQRCPEINDVVPHAGIKNTPENRMLAYAGNKYGDLVKKTSDELGKLKEMERLPENKKAYVNAGKMLLRLGNAGFAAASLEFTSKKDQYVKESAMESHYDKVAPKASARAKTSKENK